VKKKIKFRDAKVCQLLRGMVVKKMFVLEGKLLGAKIERESEPRV